MKKIKQHLSKRVFLVIVPLCACMLSPLLWADVQNTISCAQPDLKTAEWDCNRDLVKVYGEASEIIHGRCKRLNKDGSVNNEDTRPPTSVRIHCEKHNKGCASGYRKVTLNGAAINKSNFILNVTGTECGLSTNVGFKNKGDTVGMECEIDLWDADEVKWTTTVEGIDHSCRNKQNIEASYSYEKK